MTGRVLYRSAADVLMQNRGRLLPCPWCAEVIEHGVVVTVFDRYRAQRHWHKRCHEAAEAHRNRPRGRNWSEALPRRVDGQAGTLDDYEAAREVLYELSPELLQVLMAQSQVEDPERTTRDLVIRAAALASESSRGSA